MMFPEGNAIIYCEGAFNTTNGKTAHGLIRRSQRYRLLSVIDSRYAGQDTGQVLDGKKNGIAFYRDISEAISAAIDSGNPATHLVIGLAPDGGSADNAIRKDVKKAIKRGLDIVSGLHDFLSEDPQIKKMASEQDIIVRDIRKMYQHSKRHFFSGKIEEVACVKIALLGTDSAVGKRTTAWMLADELIKSGYRTQMIGTGQTAWMQGAKYSLILDSLINDFVAGEIEHVIWSAWKEEKPEIMVIEGQGSLMNPAYPGGFEILAAARPQVVVLQDAPGRKEYDGFPGYPIHPLDKQIQAIELISGKPVIAVTVNHENIERQKIPLVCETISRETGLPTCDPLIDGVDEVIKALRPYFDTFFQKRS